MRASKLGSRREKGGSSMKHLHIVLCILAMMAVSVAQSALEANSPATPTTPTITGALEGSRVAVFQTPHGSCFASDIPDAMARAFRDSTGTIHFVSASSDLFQSLGPTLESLQHSCQPAYLSANDTNPADFNDQVWLDSFYTFDGNKIAALSHTEYHGWAIQGECNVQGNNQYTYCEYDSDTYHQSNDGGYHFESFQAPSNFLAGVPYKYEVGRGPLGYSVDTNIVGYGGWFYAIATDWTWPLNCSGTTGPRSRPHLWRGIWPAGHRLGHARKAHRAPFALAEPVCRAPDRLHPARMSGAHHRFQRETFAPHSHGLSELLSSASPPQVSGTGLPGTTRYRTARPRQNH